MQTRGKAGKNEGIVCCLDPLECVPVDRRGGLSRPATEKSPGPKSTKHTENVFGFVSSIFHISLKFNYSVERIFETELTILTLNQSNYSTTVF